MATDWSKMVYANTATPYLDSYKKLADAYNAQGKLEVSNLETKRDNELKQSSAGYDNTAKQNYINYMQAQKKLPSQLNAMGIRGGASESSLIRLGTNYGSNVASNEAARQSAADNIRQAYAQQIADYNRDLAERLAQAQATAEQNQINWERERLEKDLQYFSGAIEGLYSNKKGYQNLIAQLKASNDPNKDYKIMLATRAMNQVAAAAKKSGGGGGRSYGGYGGSYGGGAVEDNTPAKAKADDPILTGAKLVKKIAADALKSSKKKTTTKRYGATR